MRNTTKGALLPALLCAVVLLPLFASVLLARGIPAILRQPGRAVSLILHPPNSFSHLQVLRDSFTHRHMPLYQVHLNLQLVDLTAGDMEAIGIKWDNGLTARTEVGAESHHENDEAQPARATDTANQSDDRDDG